MARVKTFFIALLLLLIAAAGALWFGWNSLNSAPERQAMTSELFTVEQGEVVAETAVDLHEQGLIRSPLFFRVLSRIQRVRNGNGTIKAGRYHIRPGSSSLEIYKLLVEGKQELVKITIPEGLTARRIARSFAEKGITEESGFLDAVHSSDLIRKYQVPADSLEGYLYPDTYYFQQDYPAEEIVDHLVGTFFEKLEEIRERAPGQLNPEELHRKIILASIVEREYRDPDEADKIASVFYNRLEQNMRLQSCATVVYAMTEEKGLPHPKRLTYGDLELESQFNTYIKGGLPPGPIANPGYVALQAAFQPAETDYLYFLLKDQEAGRHVFSNNLAEHNQAYTLYIKQ
ncbi:MAG TPA: endolytic transglycosylase MltG [Sediminispirochaeta sp.]|nr:endolytic transglycosylase MltG [Sediminispirochaeta sp.]